MKLKRSWFPAFRLGGNSHQTNTAAVHEQSPQKVHERPHHASLSVQNPPPGGGSRHQISGAEGISSMHVLTKQHSKLKPSASNLVRRSSSRLNVASDVALNPSAEDYGSTTTPILLSVRKRSTSDSGFSGEDSCDSPMVRLASGHNNNNNKPVKHSHGLSFLRLFHKSSATLQLQHPKAGELDQGSKPYKGTVMTSVDHQRKKKEFLKQRKLPLIPMASSSLSSLNTLQNGKTSTSFKRKNKPVLHHSSSNSVISSEGKIQMCDF